MGLKARHHIKGIPLDDFSRVLCVSAVARGVCTVSDSECVCVCVCLSLLNVRVRVTVYAHV